MNNFKRAISLSLTIGFVLSLFLAPVTKAADVNVNAMASGNTPIFQPEKFIYGNDD